MPEWMKLMKMVNDCDYISPQYDKLNIMKCMLAYYKDATDTVRVIQANKIFLYKDNYVA